MLLHLKSQLCLHILSLMLSPLSKHCCCRVRFQGMLDITGCSIWIRVLGCTWMLPDRVFIIVYTICCPMSADMGQDRIVDCMLITTSRREIDSQRISCFGTGWSASSRFGLLECHRAVLGQGPMMVARPDRLTASHPVRLKRL